MNKEINIKETEKMEDFYNDLIYDMLQRFREKYKDKKPCEYSNPDIRCAFLGDENKFYSNKNDKEIYVCTAPYQIGTIDNINIYNIYEYFDEIFEYWVSSYYSKMAIYFEGSLVMDDKFIIRIGFTLYDYKEFEKSDLKITRID